MDGCDIVELSCVKLTRGGACDCTVSFLGRCFSDVVSRTCCVVTSRARSYNEKAEVIKSIYQLHNNHLIATQKQRTR